VASPRNVKLGLVQGSASGDAQSNMKRAEQAVREAAQAGADLVCLQELYRTPYFPQLEDASLFDWAETIPGPSSELFSGLARELGIVIVVPVFEKRAAGLYHNSALVIDSDGRLADIYRKMHIPDDPLFYEKFYFAPGDTGFHAMDTSLGRIGVLICWDQWFPEAARLLALDGAEIILYPTAIGWLDGEEDGETEAQRESWRVVQRGHAIANGVFVATVNRVGQEDAVEFFGSSFVCDPQGQVLESASEGREEILFADCDLARVEEQRRGWPFLRDRRIDAYAELMERFRR